MSQLFEMCQAIVNYPENEMTVDNVIEFMNGSINNPHSIRCALSKIASKSVLLEPTSKHRGRVKVYKKRKDIDDQWDWMMAHKSRNDRLVLPDPGALAQSRIKTARKSIDDQSVRKPVCVGQVAGGAVERRIFKELAKIGKALGAIENAILDNTKALKALELGRPTVVVRKEKT